MTPSDEFWQASQVARRPSKRRLNGGNPPFPRFFLPLISKIAVDRGVYNSPSPHRASATTLRMHRTWPYPRVVGHRGGGALAPENTLAGIRKAAALGFGGVEFDVMLSADKVPLLIHDET